jgi:hypothetical protein
MENIVLNDAELATVAGGYEEEQGRTLPAVKQQPLLPRQYGTMPIQETAPVQQ